MVTESRFMPDYTTAPGEIIEEVLAAKGISKSELSIRCGLSTKTISLIVSGRAPVTPDTAIQLERILGISAKTWSNLEANYRLFLAKAQDATSLEKQYSWLEAFPVKEMEQRCWIPKGKSLAEKVSVLLNYFGVGNVVSWEEQYGKLGIQLRGSKIYAPTKEALAVWIRKCEIEANRVETKPFNKENLDFALSKVRGLSCQEPEVFEPQMKTLFEDAGVALVFVSELKDTHLCGATKWLKPEKAMVALSLRYKTDDNLWFTLFHEAAHIKLHSKKMSFIDGTERGNDNEQEREADLFAADFLIPRNEYNRFISHELFDTNSVRNFARELKIAPGLVVGRLQHDNHLPWRTKLNHLKCRFSLVETNN
jgi:HTH-type transcriptional regulator / antitoxin HigA